MAKSNGNDASRQAKKAIRAQASDLKAWHKSELAAHKSELKSYRQALAKLKSKGLLRKNVDVRHQKYTPSMLAKIRKYSDVLSGNAVVRTVKNKNIRDYYKDNPSDFIRPGLGRKVVVTNEREYKAVVKQGFIQYVRKLKSGERVKVKVPIRDLEETIKNVQGNPILYEAMKNPDDVWTFNFYGNHGRASSEDLAGLLWYIGQYQALEEDPSTVAHIEIIRTTADAALSVPRDEQFFRNRKRNRTREHAKTISESEKARQNKLRRERYARYSVNQSSKHEKFLEKQRIKMRKIREQKK